MNKKASLSLMTEMILGLILFLGALFIVIVNMNVQYNQNYDPTYGISSNNTLDSFKDYQSTVKSGMEGEASTNQINGISLSSSWGMIKTGLSLVFDFVNGQWISNSIALMHLGEVGDRLALVLRLLYILAIAFILLTILFKVKP